MAAVTLGGAPPAPARLMVIARHPWTAFLTRRLAQFVAALFVLVTAVFGMVHAIPGDPVRNALGLHASASTIAAARHTAGLDQSLWAQYVHYLHGVATGKLGTSLIKGLPVRSMLTQLMPATVELAVSAFALALIVAVPVGMITGVATHNGRGRITHVLFAATSGLLSVIPDFLLGVGLVFVFAVSLKTLPVAGRAGLDSYILPVVSLGAGPAALLSRIVRVETQRVLDEDYMRTARAKRLPWRLMYLRHAFPNLLTATLTMSGLVLSSLLAGTVLVETVFAWPGVGAQLVQSVLAKDFPVVQGLGLFFGAAVLLINLAVDVLIAVIDPRSVIRER